MSNLRERDLTGETFGLVGTRYDEMNCWGLVCEYLTCAGFDWPDTPEEALARANEFASVVGGEVRRGDVLVYHALGEDGSRHDGVAVMIDARLLLYTGPGQRAKLGPRRAFERGVAVTRVVRPGKRGAP